MDRTTTITTLFSVLTFHWTCKWIPTIQTGWIHFFPITVVQQVHPQTIQHHLYLQSTTCLIIHTNFTNNQMYPPPPQMPKMENLLLYSTKTITMVTIPATMTAYLAHFSVVIIKTRKTRINTLWHLEILYFPPQEVFARLLESTHLHSEIPSNSTITLYSQIINSIIISFRIIMQTVSFSQIQCPSAQHRQEELRRSWTPTLMS